MKMLVIPPTKSGVVLIFFPKPILNNPHTLGLRHEGTLCVLVSPLLSGSFRRNNLYDANKLDDLLNDVVDWT